MKTATLVLAVVLAGCGGSSHHSASSSSDPNFRILPTPGNDTIVEGVSDDGTKLVGIDFSTIDSYLWTRNGELTTLPRDSLYAARAITPDGRKVVGAMSGSAAIYTLGGTTQILPTPAGFAGGSIGIDANDLVALANVSDGSSGEFPYVVSNGEAILLPGLTPDMFTFAYRLSKEGFVVVGSSASKPVRWTNASAPIPTALSEEDGSAYGVSHDGKVIVGEFFAATGPTVFRWTEAGGAVKLTLPKGAVGSRSAAVSGDGTVVVGVAYGPGSNGDESHPFVWTKATGSRRIEDIVDFKGPAFGCLTDVQVSALSANGKTLAGQGRLPNDHFRGYVLTLP